MAVTQQFEEQWLECQEKYGKNIEQGDIEVLELDRIDESISLPAVKFTAPYNFSGNNTFDSYRHVPMATFKKPIDDLAEQVSEATIDLVEVKEATVDATDAANDAADRANTASDGAEKVDATLIGMTVTITDRNGYAHSQNIGFEIYKTYPSIAAMNADAANVPDGKFVMIATTDKTSEENARLYGKNSAGGFTFLSDLDQASSAAWADWMENYKPVIISDHQTAQADHTTATTDHTTATTDHTQATTDHARAETDHTTATTDHTTAESDHTTAGTDHQTAQTDHTTAGTDHTRAEQDHTRAEQDHTRAEQDHTTADSDHSTATSDHDISAGQQSTFEQNEQARQDTFDTNEAQRQQDFENAEADRMAAMTVTKAFVDVLTMELMFVQPATDSTDYKVNDGYLDITVRYEV